MLFCQNDNDVRPVAIATLLLGEDKDCYVVIGIKNLIQREEIKRDFFRRRLRETCGALELHYLLGHLFSVCC